MSTLEIVLLVGGAVIFVFSFLLPSGKSEETGVNKELARVELKELVAQEIVQIKDHVDDVVGESIEYAVEKTERSLERLSNEKIMAVNEYSDTVLEEINRNHKEVMFLYDMLNDKHQNIKDTMAEVSKAVKAAEESVKQSDKAPEPATIKPFVPQNITKVMGNSVSNAINPPTRQTSSDRQILEGTKTSLQIDEKYGFEGDLGNLQETKVRNLPEMEAQEESRSNSAGMDTVDTSGMDISFIQEAAMKGHNFNDRILELYKQGKSKVAIAQELGLGVGEVKLVVDLYKGI